MNWRPRSSTVSGASREAAATELEYMELVNDAGDVVASFAEDVDGNVTMSVDGQPKVYRALLTQTGTDDPVATVLENTLGGTPVWGRSGAGGYTVTLTGAFVGQVVPINTSGKFAGDALSAMVGDRTDDNTYTLYTFYSADLTSFSDDVLFNTYVEILVYP